MPKLDVTDANTKKPPDQHRQRAPAHDDPSDNCQTYGEHFTFLTSRAEIAQRLATLQFDTNPLSYKESRFQ
jgi:hypothetical protein